MKEDRRRTATRRNALITGCDYGLGVELVRAGLARGYDVFAGCLKPAKARVMKRLKREHGERLTVLGLDMGSESDIRRVAALVKRKTRKIDLLINNAGVYWHDGIDRVRFKAFHRMFDVNTFGPAVLIRYLRPLLRAAGNARIINISSEAGSMWAVKGPRPILAYGGTKAALNMISRRISCQLAGDGVKLAMVHPGWMRTPMGFVNGEPNQEPSDTAENVYRLADRLNRKTTGGFFHHTGKIHPW
jgi:NAD(P)-dependent dehydrogenase (short-subunit alcohol dehydrogenase family)